MRTMRIILAVVISSMLSFVASATKTTTPPNDNVITPVPSQIVMGEGVFDASRGLNLYIDGDLAVDDLRRLSVAAADCGIDLKVAKRLPRKDYLHLSLDSQAELGAEGYTLSIDQQGVAITAAEPA